MDFNFFPSKYWNWLFPGHCHVIYSSSCKHHKKIWAETDHKFHVCRFICAFFVFFHSANGNQFCIFKARWWGFTVPLTRNIREVIQPYSSQMPAGLYISTLPLALGRRGKSFLFAYHVFNQSETQSCQAVKETVTVKHLHDLSRNGIFVQGLDVQKEGWQKIQQLYRRGKMGC